MKLNFVQYQEKIKQAFGDTVDLIRLDVNCGEIKGAFYYLDGFIDKLLFEDNILKQLKPLDLHAQPYFDLIKTATYTTTPIQKLYDESQSIDQISAGDIVLALDGAEALFLFSERDYKMRAIQEPPVSNVLRGPREGFVEDLKTNMTMIRRRLSSCSLRFEYLTVGRYSATKIALAYIEGVASKKIIEAIRKRISEIDIDGIVESSYISRYIEGKNKFFTQVGTSEKPDIVSAKMLEGRIAIIVDGSPMVLTLPFVLMEHFQASEDYYVSSYRASLTRVIRLIAILFATLLPAAYVSLLSHQYQMMPLKLLVTIIGSITSVPLPPMLEMLTVLAIFEILNEASIRMPKYVGMALSIIGAIVLGETAVSAGLLSTPSLLVVAISTLGMYCVPDQADVSSVLRLIFVVIADILGLYGIVVGMVVVVTYLCSLSSYGSAYLAPYAPMLTHDWEDGVMMGTSGKMNERPYTIATKNRTRVKKTPKE